MDRERISFFDANASFGRAEVPPLVRAETADALIAEMDYVGIDEALVWHASHVNLSPVDANRYTSELTRETERLHATWAVLPHQTGELGTPDEFFSNMRHNNIKALWLRPDIHRWLPTRTGIGTMLEMASDKKIPCLINNGMQSAAGSGWGLIDGMLSDFTDLRLILTGTGSWGEDRLFRPLLEQHPGLHIEISRYELSHGIEDLVAFCGHDRIIFGSGFPRSTIGGPMLMVATAEIPLEARQAIAGDNLRRLLSEAQP